MKRDESTKADVSPKTGLAKVGRIGKLFGTDGGLTLSLYDISPDDIKKEEPLWVVIDSLAVPLFTEHFERKGRSGARVRFADIDTTQRAEEFVGQDIYLKVRTEAKPDGQLYFEDLVGYAATVREEGKDFRLKGAISGYIDSDFNPLFAVKVAEGEVLIPAVDDFMEEIDTDARRIVFVLPEGLLDLNN